MVKSSCLKLILPVIASMYLQISFAQEVIEEPQDTTTVEEPQIPKRMPRHDSGVFVQASFENGNQLGERGNIPLFAAGVEFDGFIVGGYAATFNGKRKETLIFPNEFRLIYSHGGFYAGRRIYQSRYLETDLLINWGKGNMLWERADNYSDFIEDRFTTIEPEISATFTPILPVKVLVSLGYRMINNFDLSGVNASDFEGVTINVGFRVGFFRRKSR